MMEFTTTEMEEKILERLRNADDVDKIITTLCEEYNLDWSDASRGVERIRRKNHNQIILAQSPTLSLIAIVIFIGGVALCTPAIAGVVITYKVFNTYPGNAADTINLVGF
jgi:hypothetical protein